MSVISIHGGRMGNLCVRRAGVVILVGMLLLFGFGGRRGQAAPNIDLTLKSMKKTAAGFVFAGEVRASGLNPKGQIVEDDDFSLVVDVAEGNGYQWPQLPAGMFIRPPAGAETSYTQGSGPGGTMTRNEYYGSKVKSFIIAAFPLRRSPVWRAYGGLGKWSGQAPARVTRPVQGTIPLKYAGRMIRVRAQLKHSWGGPYASWPAFSFHNDIEFVGTLNRTGWNGHSNGAVSGNGTGSGSPALTGGSFHWSVSPAPPLLESPGSEWDPGRIGNAGESSSGEAEYYDLTAAPERTEIEKFENLIKKIDRLPPDKQKEFASRRRWLQSQLVNLRLREAFWRHFRDNISFSFDKVLSYFPGTGTAWGLASGTYNVLDCNWTEALNRYAGVIPYKNLGLAYSILLDLTSFLPQSEGGGVQVTRPYTPPSPYLQSCSTVIPLQR